MLHLTRAGTLIAGLGIALGAVTGCSTAEPALTAVPAPTTAVTIPATTPTPVPATGSAPRQVGRPTQVLIPAIGVDQALYGVGLKPDGAMETPDFGDVGWYDLGPRPGARGPAVIVAHVHGPAGDDVFARLHQLRPGALVTVRRTDGTSVFVVDSVEQSAKDALPTERIWAQTDQAVLRLITCGGEPDPETRMYPDNTVVYAYLAG